MTIVSQQYRIVLNRRGALLLLCLEVIITFFFILLPPGYVRTILSMLSLLFPGISIAVLVFKDVLSVLELIFISVLFSSLFIPSLYAILSALHSPFNSFELMVTLAIFESIPLIIYFIKGKKTTINLNVFDLFPLSLVIVAILVIIFILLGLPHSPTPDENYYITGARLLINNGIAFPTAVSYWNGPIILLFTSRTIWFSLIASFIVVSGLPAINSNIVNSIFLFGLSIAGLLLLEECGSKRIIIKSILPVLIVSNPLILGLSSYVLNDLAIAFYNVASLVFFTRSFYNGNDVSVNLRNLSISFLLQIYVFFLKINYVFFMVYLFLVLVYTLKFRLYKSKNMKAVLFFTIPIILYEVAIDLPRNIALYVLHDRALELFFDKFLVVSPIENVITSLLPTSYSKSILTHTTVEILRFIYNVFSPEILSIFIASAFLFLPITMVKNKYEIKYYTIVIATLLSGTLWTIGAMSSGDWGSIQRYSVSIVVPLVIACIPFYSKIFEDEQPASFKEAIIAVFGMVVVLWLNEVVTSNFGTVFIFGYLVHPIKSYNILMLQTILFIILTIILFHWSPSLKFFRIDFLEYKFRISIRRLFIIIFLLSIIISNVYFSNIVYYDSIYSKNYGLDTINTIGEPRIILSNAYGVESYASHNMFNNAYISSFPSYNEFDSLIKYLPNGTILLIFNNTVVTSLSELFVGDYPRKLAGQLIIKSSTEPLIPSQDNPNALACINFVKNSYRFVNDVVLPKFYNILWIEKSGTIFPCFTGSKSYVEIPYSKSLNLVAPFSIEVFFFVEELTQNDQPLIDFSTPDGGYYLYIRDRKLVFEMGFGNNVHSLKDLKERYWTHVIISYNGTHTTFYINGEPQVVRGPAFKSSPTERPFLIGRSNWAFNGEIYFKGIIGGIVIYDRFLSENEVENNLIRAQQSYFKLISIYDSVYVYELISQKSLKSKPSSAVILGDKPIYWNIDLKNASIPIQLSLNLSATVRDNVTIIISCEAVSKMFSVEINPGNNIVNINLDRLFARKSSILVIDGEGEVVFRDVIGIYKYSSVYILIYGILILILSSLITIIYCMEKRSYETEHRRFYCI